MAINNFPPKRPGARTYLSASLSFWSEKDSHRGSCQASAKANLNSLLHSSHCLDFVFSLICGLASGHPAAHQRSKAWTFCIIYVCLTKPEDKKCCKCSKKYLRACVSDLGYNTRLLSQLIFCLVSVSPLSSQSLLVPQLNIFTSPSAGQLLTCPSA